MVLLQGPDFICTIKDTTQREAFHRPALWSNIYGAVGYLSDLQPYPPPPFTTRVHPIVGHSCHNSTLERLCAVLRLSLRFPWLCEIDLFEVPSYSSMAPRVCAVIVAAGDSAVVLMAGRLLASCRAISSLRYVQSPRVALRGSV